MYQWLLVIWRYSVCVFISHSIHFSYQQNSDFWRQKTQWKLGKKLLMIYFTHIHRHIQTFFFLYTTKALAITTSHGNMQQSQMVHCRKLHHLLLLLKSYTNAFSLTLRVQQEICNSKPYSIFALNSNPDESGNSY